MRGRITALLAVALLAAACRQDPAPPSPELQPEAAAAPAPAPAPERAEPPPAWPLPDEVLSPWELALVMMDPHHLTREQVRQRSYARRKQIMLNPDSPTARVLEDLGEAVQNGELTPTRKDDGVVFTAHGTKSASPPAGGRRPAGWRPPADAGDEPR